MRRMLPVIDLAQLKETSTKVTKAPCGRTKRTKGYCPTPGIPMEAAAGCGPKKPMQPPPPWPVARDRGPQARMPKTPTGPSCPWPLSSCPSWRSLLFRISGAKSACRRLALAALALLLPLGSLAGQGFTEAKPGYAFQFPRDHGSHPAFRTEWWYFTGHLRTPEGRRFGYQLTFFRQASPPGAWQGLPAWRTDQLHLAHAALTDEAGRRFLVDERLDRAGLLAGASGTRLEVFQQDWRADQDAAGRIQLHFSVRGAVLDLSLDPATPPVILGEDGVSRKGADPTAASHYITFPRLRALGSLRLPEGTPLTVQGQGWMDHEFSSNQLAPAQVGWDWAGIQLKDGRSLMVYRLRRQDGSQDPFSTLSEVDAQGRLRRSTHAFGMNPKASWKSPHSGATYPLPLELEAWGERLTLVPLLQDQELRTGRSTGITYWEGACRVLDPNGREVGEAYLELTGYAHTLKGRF